MNLEKTMQLITKKYAHRVAEYMDTALYRYMTAEIEALKKKGEDITQYEIVFITNEYALKTKDGFRIEKTARLHRIGTPL